MIDAIGQTKAWLSPQLLRGKAVSFMCFPGDIYTVTMHPSGSGSGSSHYLNVKNPDDDTSDAITVGSDWHLLDLHNSWMLFNGACVVWKTGHSDNVYVSNEVTINTGCVHKNTRAITAGFNPEDFYARADWQEYWEDVVDQLPEGLADMELEGLGPNWVRWSSLMGEDMLDLLQPEHIMDNDLAIALKWRNEAGAMPMPWEGKVLGVVEFGQGLLVYGNGGTTYMHPHGKRYSTESFSGLGDRHSVYVNHEGGLPSSRTHWAGTKHVQYFVDGGGETWRLTPDLKAEPLRGADYIKNFDRKKMFCAYNSAEDEFYISDGTENVTFVKGRICRSPYMPSNIHCAGRHAIWSFNMPTASPNVATVTTSTFTTDSGMVQTLRRIWLKGRNHIASDKWTVVVQARMRAFENFVPSPSLTPDSRGVINCAIPVLEWRLQISSTDHTQVTLEDIQQYLDEGMPEMSDRLAATPPTLAIGE